MALRSKTVNVFIFQNLFHTSSQKVAAIQQAPPPKNQQELRSFLGCTIMGSSFPISQQFSIH